MAALVSLQGYGSDSESDDEGSRVVATVALPPPSPEGGGRQEADSGRKRALDPTPASFFSAAIATTAPTSAGTAKRAKKAAPFRPPQVGGKKGRRGNIVTEQIFRKAGNSHNPSHAGAGARNPLPSSTEK
jgi:hypothetical protein